MSEYKRLTRYSGEVMQEDCRNCNYAYNNVCNYKDKENKIIYDIDEDCKKVMLNRLAELEDKIENGTLIELPCKVGDTVYEVFKEHRPPFIQETKIEKIVIVGEKGLRLRLARNSVYETAISSLGKTVFLTRAEAEAKLKELQADDEEICPYYDEVEE